MRSALVLGVNLIFGAALLGWILHRFGGSALEILETGPSIPRLLAFASMVAAMVLGFAWRWRVVLMELGAPPGLGLLAMHRAASYSVAMLIPSAKVGGDPLRAWLATRTNTPPAHAIASVAVDRALEMGAAAPFSVIFTGVLAQRGVPELQGALVTVLLGVAALLVTLFVTVVRLRRGSGLATSLVRRSRLDRLQVIQKQMGVMAAAEAAAAQLVARPRRMLLAFLIGIGVNLVVLLEYFLLLSAFGLPSHPIAIVAAIFGTAAAHFLPIPAGLGVLEGGQIWLFGMLGYPMEVGLAVGLAVRLRELVWMLPGLAVLGLRGIR